MTYEDHDGRLWVSVIRDDDPDDFAQFGILICPNVDLEPLGLPKDIEVRVHNGLYHRRICNRHEAERRATDIVAAIRDALKVGAHEVIQLFEAVPE